MPNETIYRSTCNYEAVSLAGQSNLQNLSIEPAAEAACGMKILLCSYWFYPSFGGVESITKILAEEWSKAGCKVTVVTQTPEDPAKPLAAPYAVVRQPSIRQLRQLGLKTDLIVQNIISLKTLLMLLTCGKPVVVIHNSWMRAIDGSINGLNRLKRLVARYTYNVAISKAVAADVPDVVQIIGNPFSTDDFEGLSQTPKSKTLIFMARLVSDKGGDTLIEALNILRGRGKTPDLTVIGDGPEKPRLQTMVTRFGLNEQVTFAGALREGRGAIVAQHTVMVVPSRWAEPFGIVALEGIACGCAIVASSQGGLSDAVGPCGILFANGDSVGLADAIERVLGDDSLRKSMVNGGSEHLSQFRSEIVAGKYLDLFHRLRAETNSLSRRKAASNRHE